MPVDQLSRVTSKLDLKGDLSQEEVICVDGVRDGQVYRQLRTWLTKSPNRFLVFFETDVQSFESALLLPLANDLKVRLVLCEEERFKEIAWEFLFLKFSYLFTQSEQMEAIFAQMEYYHRAVDLIASDYRDMGVSVLSNMFRNQQIWHQAKQGQSLQGKFHGTPAIICGGGDSLKAEMNLLRTLQDQAIILAGGSAMTHLASGGVRPHFALHFDPDPPRHAFLKYEAIEVPHVYQNRFASGLLASVHAPLLWMPEGGNYPIEKWLQHQQEIDVDPFDSGWTVVNFAVAMALQMGCNPIILVGVDLSSQESLEGLDMVTEDAVGQRCYTRRDWVMSSSWIGALAAAHPDRSWVNATPAGLGIPNTLRQSLAEVAEQKLTSSYDLAAKVHVACVTATPVQKVRGVIDQIQKSYATCDAICDKLLALWKSSYPASPMEKGEYALTTVDLEQEIAYQLILEPMWQIWKRPILRTEPSPLGQTFASSTVF